MSSPKNVFLIMESKTKDPRRLKRRSPQDVWNKKPKLSAFESSRGIETFNTDYVGSTESLVEQVAVASSHRAKGRKYSAKMRADKPKKHRRPRKTGTTKALSVTMPSRSLAQMSQALIDKRQRDIWAKMASKEEPRFTADEEADVIQRAESYAMSVFPDRKFYDLPASQNKIKWFPRGSGDVSLTEPNSEASDDSGDEYFPHHLRRPQRKRRSYNNIDCYVTSQTQLMAMDNSCLLPLGTKLYKPVVKLIDMVTSAIQDSPDGLLQVQHLYAVLQNKYPYFRFMDKQAVKSWRSSVRHALYQRWFRKIMLETDEAKPRGHFWALRERIHRPELNSVISQMPTLPFQYRALENGGEHNGENVPKAPSSSLQVARKTCTKSNKRRRHLKSLDVNTTSGLLYEREKQRKKKSKAGKGKQRKLKLTDTSLAYFSVGSASKQRDSHAFLQCLQEGEDVDLYGLRTKQQEMARILGDRPAQQPSSGMGGRAVFSYQRCEQGMVGVVPSSSSAFLQHQVSQGGDVDRNLGLIQQCQVLEGSDRNTAGLPLWRAKGWDLTFAHEVLLRAAGIQPRWILEQLQMVDGEDLNYIYYQVLKSKGVDVCTICNEVQETLKMDPNIYQRFQETEVIDVCGTSPSPEEPEDIEFNIININLPGPKVDPLDPDVMDQQEPLEMSGAESSTNATTTATSQQTPKVEVGVLDPGDDLDVVASTGQQASEMEAVGTAQGTAETEMLSIVEQTGEMEGLLTEYLGEHQGENASLLQDTEAAEQERVVLDRQTVYRATLRQLGIDPNDAILQHPESDPIHAYERRLEEEGLSPANIYENIIQEFQTHLISAQSEHESLETEATWVDVDLEESCSQLASSDLLSIDSDQQMPALNLEGGPPQQSDSDVGQSSTASSSALSFQFNIFSSEDSATAKARTLKNMQEAAAAYGITVEEVPTENSSSYPLYIHVNFHLPEGYPPEDFDPSFLLQEMEGMHAGSDSQDLANQLSSPGPPTPMSQPDGDTQPLKIEEPVLESQIPALLSPAQPAGLDLISPSPPSDLDPLSPSLSPDCDPLSPSLSAAQPNLTCSKYAFIGPLSTKEAALCAPLPTTQAGLCAPLSSSQAGLLAPLGIGRSAILAPLSSSQSAILASLGTSQPGLVSLSTTRPGLVSLSTTQPGLVSLSTTQPGLVSLSTTQPGLVSLSTTQPGLVSLSTTQPGLVSLSTTQPGLVSLSTSQPGLVSLSTSQPGLVSLSTSQPGFVSLSTTQPGLVSLSTSQPGLVSLSTSQPGLVSLSTTQPGLVSLSTTQPGLASLNSTQPGLASLNTTQPDLVSLSTTQPGLVSSLSTTQPGLVSSLSTTRPGLVSLSTDQLLQALEELWQYPGWGN